MALSPDGLYAFAGTETEVRKGIRSYLTNLVPSDPQLRPPALTRKNHEGLPNAFQDLFPTFLVLTGAAATRGQHRTVAGMPASLGYEARAIMPYMGPAVDSNPELGAHRVAEDICMDIMSYFLTALTSDLAFQARTTGLRVGDTSAGPADAMGNARMDRRGNYLWVESLPITINL